MKVGLDASVIFSSVGGTAVYASQLLQAMQDVRPDWTYFLYVRHAEQAHELKRRWTAPNVSTVLVEGSPNTWRVQTRLPAQMRRDGVDLYHSLGYFLPLRWRGPKVVTVHDVNMFLNWRGWARPNVILNWADMAVQTPIAVRAADRVITDSTFSKNSITRTLRIKPGKVTVIALAPDPFFDEASTAGEREEARALTSGAPFILSVGILSPQKNLGMLIAAFATSSLARDGARLVLAGSDREGHGADLRAAARKHGVEDRVLLPGFVSLPLLRALYRESLAVVMPSLGEGFGLPVVEAMACGAPVLAANRQSLPEIVGDAGSLFEPDDVPALTGLLNRLASEPNFRAELKRRGLARRRQFSWRLAAEATAAVYEEVAAARRL